MKNNSMYRLNTLLALFLGAALLVAVIVRAAAPIIIIPELDIPNMVLLSLAALLAEHYIFGTGKRCYICIPVFSALTFGLLPFAACFVGAVEAVKLGLVGAVVFTVTTWLFSSIAEPSLPVLSAAMHLRSVPCACIWLLSVLWGFSCKQYVFYIKKCV